MLAKVGELVLPAITRSGPIEAWIIDDTGFPKKGLGKQDTLSDCGEPVAGQS
jgi:SRSO17 transposase